MSQQHESKFRLVTVNTVPERATRLIGRMIEVLKDRYDLEHIANCSSTQTHNLIIISLISASN